MSNSKKKEIIGNIILIVGGVAFGLIIMEIGLRIIGISYPSFYQVDSDRGHALIPNYSAQWTHEGNGYVAINQDGLRDEEHELTKSPETYRIAVIGDSFSEAIQVNAEDTFWAAIERDLPKCPRFQNKKVEVINFGVGDYGTAQELMTIKNQVWKYQPDLVLLEIFTGNDLVNNSKALSQSDRFAPFLVEKNGNFELDMSFRETETYRRRASWIRQIGFSLINYSRVLQVINEAKRALTTRQTLVGTGVKSGNKEDFSNLIPALDFDVNLYQDPQTENWRSAWTVTEELLKLINQEVKDNNSQFLAVTISNPPQVYPDPKLQVELTKQGVADIFYPDRRIAKLGKNNNFEVLNLAPSFQAYAYKNQVFLHGFDNTLMGIGHWNKAGHQLAGKLITEHLCSSQKRSP